LGSCEHVSILHAPRTVVHCPRNEGILGGGGGGMAPLTFTRTFPRLVLFTYGHSKPLKARILAPFIFTNVTKQYTWDTSTDPEIHAVHDKYHVTATGRSHAGHCCGYDDNAMMLWQTGHYTNLAHWRWCKTSVCARHKQKRTCLLREWQDTINNNIKSQLDATITILLLIITISSTCFGR